jgi:hypothetical protein
LPEPLALRLGQRLVVAQVDELVVEARVLLVDLVAADLVAAQLLEPLPRLMAPPFICAALTVRRS